MITLTSIILLLCQAPCCAEEQDALDEALLGPSDERIEELVHATKAGNILTRTEAIWVLSKLDDERCADAIAKLIDDPEHGLRPFVSMGLGWLGGHAKGAANKLATYLKDPSQFTRMTAVWSLGRMGAQNVRTRLQPFQKSENELMRFLATEALTRPDNKEILPAIPLFRPIEKSTILFVGGNQTAPEYVLRGPLTRAGVTFHKIGLADFNPTMGKHGGMPDGEQKRLSQLLEFRDGKPQVDAVILAPLYAHELSMKLRWELWNYVRRGGKLVTTDIPLKRFNTLQTTTRHTKGMVRFAWSQSLFDSLLPESVAASNIPFLDGVGKKHRVMRYGYKAFGRGATLLMASRGEDSETVAEIKKLSHKTWRHIAFWQFIGNDRAEDPVFWHRLARWMIEGPSSFPASLALSPSPGLKAGTPDRINVQVKNYLVESPEMEVTLRLLGRNGEKITESRLALSVPRQSTKSIALPLNIPFTACESDYRLKATLSSDLKSPLSEIEAEVKIRPAVSISLNAAKDMAKPGQPMPLECTVKNLTGKPLAQVDIVISMADQYSRPLLRKSFAGGLPVSPEFRRIETEFRSMDVPPSLYQWVVEVKRRDELLQKQTQQVVKMGKWRFKEELVVSPFGFGNLQPEAEIEALRSLGLTTYGLPPSFGMRTYMIHSPSFLPRGAWPADILTGAEGDEWRMLGSELNRNPFFTFVDTVEESDLSIGSNLLHYGDVELQGHKQYRIHLKRKYRRLSKLNEAWESDYTSWDEIGLLGGVIGQAGEVLYTLSIGMTTGQLVAVPKEVDPAKGITSLQPYHDQNAWRWSYMWHLLEIRHKAFHEVDPYHALTPGGAMGLNAPFDYPHYRVYAWSRLSEFSRRATFSLQAYGTLPHTLLIGVPANENALRKLCWEGIAGGARFFMPYAPGDRYGVSLLNDDYTPNEIGRSFGKIIRQIKSKQGLLLNTRNVVHRDVLFLSEGDSGYGSALKPELYDAFLWSGIHLDYSDDFRNRKLVITGAPNLSDATIRGLIKRVEKGSTLLVLPSVSSKLLSKIGITKGETTPKYFAAAVTFTDKQVFRHLAGASLTSKSRVELDIKEGNWIALAQYADTGATAVLHAERGKGQIFVLNFDKSSADLKAEYQPGKPRSETENFRKFISSIASTAGFEGAFQTSDAEGNAIPYVAAQLIESEDSSQRYLVVFADHQLPAGVETAEGHVRILNPQVKKIYDTYAEQEIPFTGESFKFKLSPGDGTIFSLLTEELESVKVAAEVSDFQPGAPLRLRIEARRSDGKLCESEHAFQVRVYDSNGDELKALKQDLTFKGIGTAKLFPSWSDPDGEWRIVALDLTSGLKGETSVTKRKNAPPPPATPGKEFIPVQPQVRVTVLPLPKFDSSINFVQAAVMVESRAAASMKFRVSLRVPEVCLLEGTAEREIELSPGSPRATLKWVFCISRDEAVALYYSGQPARFITDSFRPEVSKYRGQNLPAIELESLNGERITIQEGDNPVSDPAKRHRMPMPIDLNPFEKTPARIGSITQEPVALTISNHTPSPVSGSLKLSPHTNWKDGDYTKPYKVGHGEIKRIELQAEFRPGAIIDPGINRIPFIAHTGNREVASAIRVEHVRQRPWLVMAGEGADSLQGKLPFEPAADFLDAEWQKAVSESKVPVEGVLHKIGSRAYAACYVHSPGDQEVRFKIDTPGAEVRVWLNGFLAYTSEKKENTEKLKHPAPDEEEDDQFLREAGVGLQKGKNYLVLEFFRTAKRYRDAPLFLTNSNGKNLRNLTFKTSANDD